MEKTIIYNNEELKELKGETDVLYALVKPLAETLQTISITVVTSNYLYDIERYWSNPLLSIKTYQKYYFSISYQKYFFNFLSKVFSSRITIFNFLSKVFFSISYLSIGNFNFKDIFVLFFQIICLLYYICCIRIFFGLNF